jgi:IS4 transposase
LSPARLSCFGETQISRKVKKQLNQVITEVSSNPEKFAKNPQKDFTRNRILTFKTTIELVLQMAGQSLQAELLKHFKFNNKTPTSSALIQVRDKIKVEAFETVFKNFTCEHKNILKYRGYRLFAKDGSDLKLPLDPENPETYQPLKDGGVNLLHINALYDLLNKFYVDVILKGKCQNNEYDCLCEIVDRVDFTDKSIIIADRGYESYNVFAHIAEAGQKYVIRVKDKNSTGILRGLDLPKSAEFDTDVELILTRLQTNEVKQNPQFKILPSKVKLDCLPPNSKGFYPLRFRVARVKIAEDSYETLITNLDSDEFSAIELKEIYQMRWGIETSFRELKYALGLAQLHSKKLDSIKQEVYARLIVYNFSMLITKQVIVKKKRTKWGYQVNFTRAIEICKHFLSCSGNSKPDVEALISRYIEPIRKNRSVKRLLKNKTFVSFLYRVA